jgi:predicted transcriptional regulator
MLSNLMERFFDNSAEKLVNTLLEVEQLDATEHERLQQLINNYQPEGETDE